MLAFSLNFFIFFLFSRLNTMKTEGYKQECNAGIGFEGSNLFSEIQS